MASLAPLTTSTRCARGRKTRAARSVSTTSSSQGKWISLRPASTVGAGPAIKVVTSSAWLNMSCRCNCRNCKACGPTTTTAPMGTER